VYYITLLKQALIFEDMAEQSFLFTRIEVQWNSTEKEKRVKV
jgi:hypothetical protein